MSIFRESSPPTSALSEYLDEKRREFIGASGEKIGTSDFESLRTDLHALQNRLKTSVLDGEQRSECRLIIGRVQSGKTGHQLGMLAWAADHCDVAVIFTGMTEALNGQTSDRIQRDLASLPSSPV